MDALPFGERLRLIRRGLLVRTGPAIRVRVLARCAGLSHTTHSEAEHGKGWAGKLPSIEDLEALARCLGVTIPQLIGREVAGLGAPVSAAGRGGEGEVRLPYAMARELLAPVAEARDGPLDDGSRLDALLARIAAQLPPGEPPEALRDADEREQAGGT